MSTLGEDANHDLTRRLVIWLALIGGCTSPSKELAYQRVIAQRYTPPFIGGSLRECMGLAQGRRHVLCTGDEIGVDPLYPYEG